MALVSLGAFIVVNRDEIVSRCTARALQICPRPSTVAEIDKGIPMFLDQLVGELGHDASQTRVIRKTALQHGGDLFRQGFTVSQVVHDYGNVCQSLTDLALELAVPISTDDFRTLNRCLDDAIAGAVTEYVYHLRLAQAGQAHVLQELIDTAFTAFKTLQAEYAGAAGATGTFVHDRFLEIRAHIEAIIASQTTDVR